MKLHIYCALVSVAVLLSSAYGGGLITSPSWFGADATVVDFDAFPDGTDLTTQVAGLAFSSESADHIGFADVTDPADTGDRFDGPFKVLSAVAGGGTPVSSPRYAAGVIYNNMPVSDMRIDFDAPQTAFGFWIIDNDFSWVRIRSFDSAGGLLDALLIPQQSEGGSVFRGLSYSDPSVSYVILDAPDNGPLDSTFIDDLYFVPEPATLTVLLLGGVLLFRRPR